MRILSYRTSETTTELKKIAKDGLKAHSLKWTREQHCGFSSKRWVGMCTLCNNYIRLGEKSERAFTGTLVVDYTEFKKDCWGAELRDEYRAKTKRKRNQLLKIYHIGGINAVIDKVAPLK